MFEKTKVVNCIKIYLNGETRIFQQANISVGMVERLINQGAIISYFKSEVKVNERSY